MFGSHLLRESSDPSSLGSRVFGLEGPCEAGHRGLGPSGPRFKFFGTWFGLRKGARVVLGGRRLTEGRREMGVTSHSR